MLYQFIEITHNYLSFRIEVNINIKNKDTADLPSITFCWRAENPIKTNNVSDAHLKSCTEKINDIYEGKS